MKTPRNTYKAARLAAIVLLVKAGELDLDAISQAELARRFDLGHRSTAMKDLRQIPDVLAEVNRYVESFRADAAAGIGD